MFAQLIKALDPRSILALPSLYRFFQDIVGANALRRSFISNVGSITSETRILEIGCGVGSNLDYLPEGVKYVGFDISEKYILQARCRYAGKGDFFVSSVTDMNSFKQLEPFDFVFAIGVLHHLPDNLIIRVCEQAKGAMRSGGKFITFDPCWMADQPLSEKIIAYLDRGKYIRATDQYINLLKTSFSSFETKILDTRHLPFASTICVIKAGV